MGIKKNFEIIAAGQIRDAAIDILRKNKQDPERDATTNMIILLCADMFEEYFFGGGKEE